MMAGRISFGAGMGEPLFREHGRQVAALCWRTQSSGLVEVLLITSLNSKRWIIPKGWPEDSASFAVSAAREAFEEAGVTGEIGDTPLGSYHYLKEKKDGSGMPCMVEIFGLKITGQAEDWPEKGTRELAWLSPEQASVRISEPGLRSILRTFHKTQTAARPRRRAG
jgi:8-oxo-dGTP pyrophosphatase MutT (NUDIX family)